MGNDSLVDELPRTLPEILRRQEAIRNELKKYEEAPPPDETEAERTERETFAETLLDQYDQLEGLRAPLAKRMERLDSVLRKIPEQGGTGDGPGASESGDGGGPKARRTRSERDPFENIQAVRNRLVPRKELRERALDAIERANKYGALMHDYAERATEIAQNDPGIQRHILLTGNDEYVDAFRAYMEDPEANAQRAALSLTNANGGYMLPFVLDPSIILTNTGSANPWRRLGRNVQTTSNTWNGVTSAGVTAEWLAEGTEATDKTPTVGNIQITPQKGAAWLYGSYEILADTDFNTELPGLLGDARDRLEEAAFATGTGTGTPKGVIAGATTTVTATGTASYAIADVYSLQGALPARFRNSPSAAFVMNLAILNRTRQFDTAGGSSFWTNLGGSQPERLLGAPLYESTTMDGVLTTGKKIAVYGDFRQFIIVDRVGASLLYEPNVKGSNGRPTGQAGWFLYWRVGSDVATPAAFRVLVTG